MAQDKGKFSIRLSALSGALTKVLSVDKTKLAVSEPPERPIKSSLHKIPSNTVQRLPAPELLPVREERLSIKTFSRGNILSQQISSGGSNLKRETRTVAQTIVEVSAVIKKNPENRYRVDVMLKRNGFSDLMILDARYIEHEQKGLAEQLYKRSVEGWKPAYITLKY